MKKLLVCLLSILMLLLAAFTAAAEDSAMPAVGDSIGSFTVVNVGSYSLVGAEMIELEHNKTGAKVVMMLNDDTNRYCNIAFRTPSHNSKGTAHVFEHATLDGSEKYPSSSLFFNLSTQTYNTMMNASTYYAGFTGYKFSSLSESQLLATSDYYLDSVFNPSLMTDEGVFNEEAWRYALDSVDSELTIDGTVYSEMMGAYDLNRQHSLDVFRAIFPGALNNNSSGGIPEFIPQLTWEELKEFHDMYYHPSNSITLLYGKFDDYAAFLDRLDEYFSKYEKKEMVFDNGTYAPITGPVIYETAFAAAEGTDITGGSKITKAYQLGKISHDDTVTLDLLTTILNSDGSVYKQLAKEKLPSASVSTYIETDNGNGAIIFSATNVNREDSEAFSAIVDETIKDVAENGFSMSLVDAVSHEQKIATLLGAESASVGESIAFSIMYYSFLTDEPHYYIDILENIDRMSDLQLSGVYAETFNRLMSGNNTYALVTTYPLPGLKEKQEAALKDKLAKIKAQMTQDELEAIVADTAALAQPPADDSSALVASIQAVSVSSLPEEIRLYDIQDELDEDGIRRIFVEAKTEDLGYSYLLLNASGIAQEDLHWYRLFTTILGELDTENYSLSDLSTRMTRYLYNYSVNTSTYMNAVEGQSFTPYLRITFMALKEDLPTAYELLHEMIFSTKFDDAQKVLDFVVKSKNAVKNSINSDPYGTIQSMLYARFSQTDEYYINLTKLEYYDFLSKLEESFMSNPDEALGHLKAIQSQLKNRYGAVAGYAGNAQGKAENDKAVNAFLAHLDKTEITPVTYDFTGVSKTEALLLDTGSAYNIMYASYEELGIPEFTADIDVICRVVRDKYLLPLLREQYGAYTVGAYADKDAMVFITYSDPNIDETYAVMSSVPDLFASLTLEQDEIDGYVKSAYSKYAASNGELSGAYNAMLECVSHEAPDKKIKHMQELKAVKSSDLQNYMELLRKFVANKSYITAASASKVNNSETTFETVLNPFASVDTSKVSFTDAPEDYEYYTAVRFVFENAMMQPALDTEFGVNLPVTNEDFALAVYKGMGGGADVDEAINYLAQFGIINPALPHDTVMTRMSFAQSIAALCKGFGIDLVPQNPLADYSDAGEIPEGYADSIAFLIENGLLKAYDDGTLRLTTVDATRADLANAVYLLFN
ncbi:MAG: insulinase family protein [Eubacteriales bacterium]|nr:insulinase family protein [Eubacteriales bacterium]